MFLKHWQLLGRKVVDMSTNTNIPAQEVPYILTWLNITWHHIILCALSGSAIDSNILELNRKW